MNQFNALHGKEPNELPGEWNSQPPAAHLESKKFPPNTIPLVSDIMGILNHHAIYIDDVDFHPSEFPVEFNYESVPNPCTTLIKSIHDYEMEHLLELFHSEHDEYLLYVDIHILQIWLVVNYTSRFYIVYAILFHKYGGANYVVTICM